MVWIWQHKDWPKFRYETERLSSFEGTFLHKAGMAYGAMRHMEDEDRHSLKVQLLSEEAIKTSAIEGEILDRDSVQSSIQRQLGLKTPERKIPPAERGISEMMVDVYQTSEAPLDHQPMFRWHTMLTNGRRDLRDIGRYRTDSEPMQIVSGRLHEIQVHYEAPPSATIEREMSTFITWYNETCLSRQMGAIARSGLAHLYFECIHPFEDGNGRIGRALSEKALSQHLKHPVLITLSRTIDQNKKEYYAALQRNSSGDLDVTDWLLFFADMVLKAQDDTQAAIDFLIAKAKFYDLFKDRLNSRQDKVIARMFREGPQGFKGGLSADNYIRITETTRPTATRDLQDLVAKGALSKTGELRYTRYYLNFPDQIQ